MTQHYLHQFVVLIPYRNAGKYLDECMSSILNQLYPQSKIRIFLLDDASDDYFNEVNFFYDNVKIIRRPIPIGAMENIVLGLRQAPAHNGDIILLIDGDDYLTSDYAFQIINGFYNDGALLTVGRLMNNYGQLYPPILFSKEFFDNLRQHPWLNPHPKTFKYKLFRELLAQDPCLSTLKWPGGRFFTYTSDMALMFPFMEIAGRRQCRSIPNILYCYRQHKNNVHADNTRKKEQIDTERYIRHLKPLKQKY